MSKTAFIACGALGRELVDLIRTYQWDADVIGVSSMDHVYTWKIAPDVEKRILQVRDRYDRLIVVFGDCGSMGALDKVLDHYGVERIAGPHCYEMYGGALFEELMAEEPGTFFLTDFMIRAFRGSILKSLGLDRYPELRDDYFRNYKRVVYMAQKPDETLLEKAQLAAATLGLPLEVRYTGYGWLETRLVALMEGA